MHVYASSVCLHISMHCNSSYHFQFSLGCPPLMLHSGLQVPMCSLWAGAVASNVYLNSWCAFCQNKRHGLHHNLVLILRLSLHSRTASVLSFYLECHVHVSLITETAKMHQVSSVYASTHRCIYVSVYLCIHASMYICMYACMYILIYVYIYICIYM